MLEMLGFEIDDAFLGELGSRFYSHCYGTICQ
jgi:hypothetical protein